MSLELTEGRANGTTKSRRVRDPVHDLIEFGTDHIDQLAWRALDTREFQRLRRIKQLGFSELVFPGATHSRLVHSIGVFYTARQLSTLIDTRLSPKPDASASATARIAALVHDLGHGPFSHSFEDALKKVGLRKKHESWTSEIVLGDTEVSRVLYEFDPSFPKAVSDLLVSEVPTSIYSSIVSSQFDADRLDYVRRDRMMTGVQHGGFDFSWLMANLDVEEVIVATDGEQFARVETLILGNKAFQAAEAYVLGLFHLYFTVYFHRATRSAEKMISAIIQRCGHFVKDGASHLTALAGSHPLVRFLNDPSLSNYLDLDDFVVWSALHEMQHSGDALLAELSSRLLSRRLFKGIDVSSNLIPRGGQAAVARFRAGLATLKNDFGPFDILDDTATRSPYKRREYDSKEALSRVLIRRADGIGYEDLAERSSVVANLQQQSTYRVYVRNEQARIAVMALLEEAGR